jgi:hypothetical protein
MTESASGRKTGGSVGSAIGGTYEFRHEAIRNANDWLGRIEDDPDPEVQKALLNARAWLVMLDQKAAVVRRHVLTEKAWLRCNETGEVYKTQTAAAHAAGVSQGLISRHLKGELKSVGGYTFTRIQIDDLPSHAAGRPVVCNETGEIFSSQVEAAEQLGMSRNHLVRQLAGRIATAKGMTFRFATAEDIHAARAKASKKGRTG